LPWGAESTGIPLVNFHVAMETHGQVIWNMALFVDDVPMISMMIFHGKPVDKKRERERESGNCP